MLPRFAMALNTKIGGADYFYEAIEIEKDILLECDLYVKPNRVTCHYS